MFKKIAALAAVATLGVTALTASANATTTAGTLRIDRIGYNAVGTDTYGNRNAEVVILRNDSAATIDFTVDKYRLSDNYGSRHPNSNNNTYLFGTDFDPTNAFGGFEDGKLNAGQELWIYTGEKQSWNCSKPCYFKDKPHHYLNNGGDQVTLQKDTGGVWDIQDRVSWDFNFRYMTDEHVN